MTSPAIDIRGLRKSFDDQVVLDGVDLAVAQGSILALLGPNGSGKTTLVHILSTLLAADSGAVLVDGHDVGAEPAAVRAVIGVTGQFSALDDLLTGRENLALMADLLHLDRDLGRARIRNLLDRFELTDAADRPAGAYSGGMRRRLDLAMTLMGTPAIIFLDEPTTGLDPNSRRTMWTMITDLAHDGRTILLTTQYLEEADHLADRIAVLDRGHIVAEGTPGELKARLPGGHIRLEFPSVDDLDAASALMVDASRDDEKHRLSIPSDGSVATLRNVLGRLDDAGIDVETLSLQTPDLNDVFFALTGRPAASESTPAASESTPVAPGRALETSP